MSPEKTMSKRQAMRAKRERQARIQQLSILGIVVVGALLLAFALIYPNVKPIGKVAAASSRDRPMVNDNAMGDPNAPIKVEEFSDFQCPYCQKFYLETENQIVENYVKTGKVYFIYRSMGNFLAREAQVIPNQSMLFRPLTVLVIKENSGNITISCLPIRPAKVWVILHHASLLLMHRNLTWI